MKKIFITLLILTGAWSVTLGQYRYKAPGSNNNNSISPEFGASIGYNGAYLDESDSYGSSDIISGFNATIYGDFPVSNSWSIKVKASYDQKGYGNGFITDGQGNEIDGVDFRLNYITVPILATWHFGWNRNWYVHFGPYVGFLLNAKETEDNIDVKDQFNTTDAGVDLGLGFKFPINNNTKLFLEYDGQAGFADVFKDTADNGSVQNIRSSFNFGVAFSVK